MSEFIKVNQNPGDLILPDGWEPISKKNVLVLGSKTELIDRTKFDVVAVLRGSDPLNGDEEKVLDETTIKI